MTNFIKISVTVGAMVGGIGAWFIDAGLDTVDLILALIARGIGGILLASGSLFLSGDDILKFIKKIKESSNLADALKRLNSIEDSTRVLNAIQKYDDVDKVVKLVNKYDDVDKVIKGLEDFDNIDDLARYLKSGSKLDNLSIAPRKLQHEFKHASDFGITGNWNKANGELFEEAIINHTRNADTILQGT